MPGYLDDAIKEIREVEQHIREVERLKEEVRTLSKARDRQILTQFVQQAIDKKRLVYYYEIFKFIDEFIEERNK